MESLEPPAVFVPVAPSEHKLKFFGMDIEYSDRISYGQYYHSELYQPRNVTAQPMQYLRVGSDVQSVI